MAVKKELKLKAKIQNLKEIKEKVKSIAKFSGKKEFVDYFFRSDKSYPISELRLRKLYHEKIITLKIPSNKNQIQENLEYKFRVDKADDFVNFLEYTGFKPCCLLRKTSEVHSYKNIFIELTNIERLVIILSL